MVCELINLQNKTSIMVEVYNFDTSMRFVHETVRQSSKIIASYFFVFVTFSFWNQSKSRVFISKNDQTNRVQTLLWSLGTLPLLEVSFSFCFFPFKMDYQQYPSDSRISDAQDFGSNLDISQDSTKRRRFVKSTKLCNHLYYETDLNMTCVESIPFMIPVHQDL